MKRGELRLRPPGGSFPGFDRTLAEATGVTRREIRHVDWTDDGRLTVIYLISAADPSSVTAALEADESVRAFELVAVDDADHIVFVQATASDLVTGLLEIVDSNALVLDGPIECVDGGFRLSIAGTTDAASDGYAAVPDDVDVTVDRIRTYEPSRNESLRELTDRQRTALETAYELGYYESPRATTYEQIAAELDCAPSTANDLLRRAEATLIATVLES